MMHVCVCSIASVVSVATWTVACQTPLSMKFSRQEYCSGLPFPFPGDLTDPGTKSTSPVFPALQVDQESLICNYSTTVIS